MMQTYQDVIWRVALNYTKNPTDAEDVAQNTLLRIYRAKSTPPLGDAAHLRYWVLRIAVNESKRWLAAPWHIHRQQSLPLPEELPATTGMTTREQTLYAALETLPAKYRITLYLFYYEDLPVKEIAALLNISATAVTTRLARGRGALKAHLEGVFFDV
ncbi:MAG: sigma-70 family RNA polymerase sigma factor [Gemmiger sp.]|nr:sigma-70 family RNA polymerase sigma factor [Gemmiger sp.]